MCLETFKVALVKDFSGSLFKVRDAEKVHPRAKEYLHGLGKDGEIRRVSWGWYCIPEEYRDPWDFLTRDRGGSRSLSSRPPLVYGTTTSSTETYTGWRSRIAPTREP